MSLLQLVPERGPGGGDRDQRRGPGQRRCAGSGAGGRDHHQRSAAGVVPPFAARRAGGTDRPDPRVLYEGSPSWRAYLGLYLLGGLATIIVPVIFNWFGRKADATTSTRVLLVLIPLAMAAIFFAGLHFYKQSIRFRVTSTNVETERGILSKKIDVLELWRCRDVRYRQNLVDRLLGIAHIDIFTTDATTPNLEIVGVPSSRKLFENLRDAIQIQRQSQNVYGVVS
ncbi:MAG: PH domain-containing protein [Kofleriaceae bacterium]